MDKNGINIGKNSPKNCGRAQQNFLTGGRKFPHGRREISSREEILLRTRGNFAAHGRKFCRTREEIPSLPYGNFNTTKQKQHYSLMQVLMPRNRNRISPPWKFSCHETEITLQPCKIIILDSGKIHSTTQENIPTTTGKHPYYNRKTPLLQQEIIPTTTGKSCHNAKKTCAKGGRADITTIERHAATRRCSARALNRRGPDSRGKATGWALSACSAANPATAASIKKKGRQDAHFHTLSLISTAKVVILRPLHPKTIFLRLP